MFFLLTLTSFLNFGQNKIINGNWEETSTMAGVPTPWMSTNATQVLIDDLTNSKCGNVNNGEGSIYQVFNVIEGTTYNVLFDYRWVGGSGNLNMTVRVKDGTTGGNDLGTLTLNTTSDTWSTGAFSFIAPSGISKARIIFYKGSGNRPLRMDNVYVAVENTSPPSLVDTNTPVNAQPIGVSGTWDLDFSDEFNDSSINTSKWIVSISNSSRAARPLLGVDDWWWKAENAFLNGTGDLILRGTKVDGNTMYCGSVESRNLYEPTYGYLEARIQIAETTKGNHTAFWLQGSNQGNVDNSAADGAEVDIFESAWVTNDTKAVVHFDGYGPQRKNHTIPYNTPNLHNGYHTFGLHWTATAMDIYYDGVKVVSTNPNKPLPFTVDLNGYPLVPQVPEWLWLSVGASFGDGNFQSQPIGILSDAMVDYVRVYKPASTLGLEVNTARNGFRLFPNPTKNTVNIKSLESDYLLKVYGLNGRELINAKHSKSAKIDIGTF
tara:strand:- start:1965 stop:3437 length:1473 start_codon:yes stop_codon:yes gene_type:complete